MRQRIFGCMVSLLFFFFCLIPSGQARENVTDWYIQDFKAQFDVATDSTMLVTEWITADCGQCVGKHGIFRIVPTEARTEKDTILMPVELVSITDFQGSSYNFTTTENTSNHTLTWKIGDANVTVTGVHQYQIVYRVKNVVRFGNANFDEFYHNVSGNFWTLDIDAFSADIIFPPAVHPNTMDISYYTGVVGSKSSDLAYYDWKNDYTLSIVATRSMKPGEGITLSASLPKGIFAPYQPTWLETYGGYLWFILPLLAFMACFRFWWLYGRDPKWEKVVIPEYEVPENLDALSFGMLSTNGMFKNEFLTAAIVQLAVQEALTIRENDTKILFFSMKSFVLKKKSVTPNTLSAPQEMLLGRLFAKGDTVALSSLKDTFYKELPSLKKAALDSLTEKSLIERRSYTYRVVLCVIGSILFFLSWTILPLFGNAAIVAGSASAAIIFIFGLIMPKRTGKGVEVNWKIHGLKLYMKTAEQYRQQFYEKENIFDTLLPYAIVFGMTKEWIKKMQEIYGQGYFTSYHPAWFVASGLGNFNADSFTSQLDSLSSSIASNTGTSSGSQGGGSSGGGGGGGGGGGW